MSDARLDLATRRSCGRCGDFLEAEGAGECRRCSSPPDPARSLLGQAWEYLPSAFVGCTALAFGVLSVHPEALRGPAIIGASAVLGGGAAALILLGCALVDRVRRASGAR